MGEKVAPYSSWLHRFSSTVGSAFVSSFILFASHQIAPEAWASSGMAQCPADAGQSWLRDASFLLAFLMRPTLNHPSQTN